MGESQYFKLYRSGLAVFKNYPIFGVGNKNYRVETCKSKIDQIKYGYECTTHPHQTYVEMLSENGLVGTLIIIGSIFFMMFKILKEIFYQRIIYKLALLFIHLLFLRHYYLVDLFLVTLI